MCHAMAGWLHGVFVGEWLFVFPLCGFSLSLFCNYTYVSIVSNFAHFLFSVNSEASSPLAHVPAFRSQRCPSLFRSNVI